jgi:hypothetical protein
MAEQNVEAEAETSPGLQGLQESALREAENVPAAQGLQKVWPVNS